MNVTLPDGEGRGSLHGPPALLVVEDVASRTGQRAIPHNSEHLWSGFCTLSAPATAMRAYRPPVGRLWVVDRGKAEREAAMEAREAPRSVGMGLLSARGEDVATAPIAV